MASTRKLRNVNKRFSKDFEGWPDNDRASANKSTPRKRKLSDMLGSQWSKEELERFYEAYRKYGKDWKKIASTVRNRSHEMVEALYSMNKAYLSLPEGTATAAGLIAMMTDHYNILEGSDSDGESNDGSKTSRKPQKRGRGKFRAVSKVSDGCSTDQALLNPSRYGCLSLLKKQSGDPLAGNRPRAVGKRTPRVPVSNMYNKNDKGRLSLVEPPPKSELAADDEGAHVAALALAEVLQRGGSPQVSRTPRMRVYQMKSSPVKSTEEKSLEPEMGRLKLTGVTMNDDCLEASLGSREAENGDFVREGTDGIEASKKVKKRHGKSPQVNTKNIQIDDDREACSGTEEGSTIRKIKDEIDMEIRDSRPARGPKSSRKRSRQLFFGDESSALDALQTLADLSVNLLPVSAAESESSTQVKEEKPKINSDQKSNMPEQFLPSHHPVKANILGKKERINASSTGSDVINKRSPKVVKGLHQDTNAISEMNQQACACASRMDKRKGKSANVKILKSEFTADSKKSELQKTEVSTDEGKVSKVKRSVQVSPQLKQGKLQKVQENSSVTESVVPVVSASGATVQIAGESQTSLVTKRRSRRKLDLQKAQALKESKSHETSKDHRADRPSYAFSWMDEIKEKLPHCLSCKLLRRWCMFEWFYSAIDYPWFAKSEFVEYLNHVRLGHIPRLTRVEWGVIRSSLGKPRRLSNQFLQEEREKLEQYRESVRMHYAEFRVGLREGLPTDLAKPLQVGQRVIACHPKTREIHDGSVLTVDRNRCRIQFDRPQLGVEFVMDIDCMPLNPLENIPEALRVHNIGFRRYSNSISNITANENGWKSGGSMKLSPDDSVDVANGNSPVLASSYPMSTLMKQAKGDTIDAVIQAKATVHEVAVAAQQAIYSQPFTLSQIQEREADIRALAELSRALDKKEALLIELRHMNEVAEKQKDDDTIKDLENFRKQYAIILVQLRDVNDQVASSLHSLRQRNTYHGSSTLPWIGTMETSGGPVGPPEAFNQAFMNQDSGSHVVQIVETSRQKARRMVDTAVQALCALNEGEDPFTKIGEALDSTHIRDPVSGGSMPGAPSPFAGHTLPANQDNAKVCTLDPSVHVPGSKPNDSSAADLQLPSDLISSCVSILLMIQTCTERQYPPAEIAQILDSAVASLQPCCPQNLPIYREIESCMGIIKNQMLSLIPTPSNISLSEIAIG